jgi:hypothetical protein
VVNRCHGSGIMPSLVGVSKNIRKSGLEPGNQETGEPIPVGKNQKSGTVFRSRFLAPGYNRVTRCLYI